jgi:hypothetical protein
MFLEFIRERERARIAKLHGIFPHTNDPIIREFSFCNVNREHDNVTVWIRKNVRSADWARESATTMAVAMTISRVFNHPPILEKLFDIEDLEEMRAKVHELKKAGKVFRGAYKMPAHGRGGLGNSSIDYFMDAITDIQSKDFDSLDHLEDASNLIQESRGFGPFLANQIVTDLRYTEFFANAPDWETFVLCGPGTRRGLSRFFDIPLKTRPNSKRQKSCPMPQSTAFRLLGEARGILSPFLGKPFTDYFRDPNNFSNCFCEFSKYARAREGGQPPKMKYRSH